MKVLLIPAWYDEDKKVASFILDQANAISARGIEVSVLLVYIMSKKRAILNLGRSTCVISESNGLQYITVHYAGVLPYQSLGLQNLQLNLIKKKVVGMIRKLQTGTSKFDVLHLQSVCNSITPAITAALSKAFKIPYIITEHFTSFKEAGHYIFAPFTSKAEVQKIVSQSALNMSVSSYAAELHSAYFETAFEVLPNVIPTLFEKPAGDGIEKHSKFTFLAVGAVAERKGVDVLLEAFMKAFDKNDQVQLFVVGEGELKSTLIELCKANKREQQILFFPQKERSDLIQMMDEAHVLVSASINETFGLTIVEGFFRGLPAIVTNSGGPLDFVNSTNGYMCEARNVTELATALARIKNNYLHFDAEQIRKEAMMQFSEVAFVNKLQSKYKTIIGTKQSSAIHVVAN